MYVIGIFVNFTFREILACQLLNSTIKYLISALNAHLITNYSTKTVNRLRAETHLLNF